MSDKKDEVLQKRSAVTLVPRAFFERVEKVLHGLTEGEALAARKKIVDADTPEEIYEYIRTTFGLVLGENEKSAQHGR